MISSKIETECHPKIFGLRRGTEQEEGWVKPNYAKGWKGVSLEVYRAP